MDEEEYSDEFGDAEEDIGASGRASTAGEASQLRSPSAANEPIVDTGEQELSAQLDSNTAQWRDPDAGSQPRDARSQPPDAGMEEPGPDPERPSVASEHSPEPGSDSDSEPTASQTVQRDAPEDVPTSQQVPQLPPSPPVFLSCKWPEGSEWAVALASELERLGVTVKHDARFSNKQAAVEQMITDCSCFVMLVTPGYYQALCNHPNGNRALKEVRERCVGHAQHPMCCIPHLGQGA